MGPNDEIAGYAVADDVSARDLQRSEEQWTRAKGFDTLVPVGPVDHDRRRGPGRRGLRITTHVNGEQRQDGNTSDLIFGPEELVDFIAETCTLEPGAIILTGTPSGVGEAFDPPPLPAAGRRRALSRSRASARSSTADPVRLDDPVDQAVLGGLIGLEEAVALHVACGPAPRAAPCAWRRSRRSACGS